MAMRLPFSLFTRTTCIFVRSASSSSALLKCDSTSRCLAFATPPMKSRRSESMMRLRSPSVLITSKALRCGKKPSMQPTTNMLSYSVPHRFCGRQMCTTCGSSVHTGSEMAACSSSSRVFAVSSPTMSAATASNSLMPSAPMAFIRPKPRRVAFFSRKSWPERHFSASVRARRNGSFAPKPALPIC